MPVVAADPLKTVVDRLASLLAGHSIASTLAAEGDLDLVDDIHLRSLERGAPPEEAWAVDGGQAVVADARCLRLVVTRAARVRARSGEIVAEEPGALRPALLGPGIDPAPAVASAGWTGAPVRAEGPVDLHLLRDLGEWSTTAACVAEARPGAVVLVDGDLRADRRLPQAVVAEVLAQAARSRVTVAGITKHSSLARHGAPLIGSLELEAEARFGPRATWWTQVAKAPAGAGGPELSVVVAHLDPDARFAFRVDLPAAIDPGPALAALSALSDDAAFPGYPYPLAMADRLAACPRWLCDDLRRRVDELLERCGVVPAVRERAFADRHAWMERS